MRNNRIKINYVNKHTWLGNYNRKAFVLPNTIKIDKNFIEGISLFLGDGDYHRKDKNHLTFASKDKGLIKFFLDFLRLYFNIKDRDITLSIIYKKENKSLINEWGDYLNIRKDRIFTKFSNRHKYETCGLQVNGVVFRKLFEMIIRTVLEKEKFNFIRNKELRIAFLRGIFAAEGNVGVQYNDGKHYINQIDFGISTKEHKLKNLICYALKLENINYRIYINKERHSLTINISNWRNYIKLWKIRIFDLCERKKTQFTNIANKLDIYLKLNPCFREKFFKSLNMHQRDIAGVIDSWQANVCRTVKGKHLLRIEQLLKLQAYSSFNIKQILSNSEEIRIGQLTNLKSDNKLIGFIKEFKSF